MSTFIDGLRIEYQFANSSSKMATVTSRSSVCIDIRNLKMLEPLRNKNLALTMKKVSAS